jgi:RNA polymerase sigma-70 factor (ECF subfamily)
MATKFATTSWSQVLTARDAAGTEAHQAMEALCNTYWSPLYAFVRHQGYNPDEAGDLTQAYFAHLLGSDTLQGVDPDSGRFRSYLLSSLKHFLSHEREKTQAAKRGGTTWTISLDTDAAESQYGHEPAGKLTPEEIFERRWAMTVVERAMALLSEESAEAGGQDHFKHLKTYLTGEEPHVPYREMAQILQMTEGAIKTAVRRMRQRFGHLMRHVIAETVADPDEIDEEVRYLLTVIAPWDGRPLTVGRTLLL